MSKSTQEQERTSAMGGSAKRPEDGEAAAALTQPSSAEEEEREERAGLPEDAPEELLDAARGDLHEKGDPEGDQAEATVLNFLLGPTTPLEFDVDALIDTPSGQQKVVFHFRQLDDTKIEELEAEFTEGEGPFRRVDRKMLNAAKVAAATLYIEDADGTKVEINSKEFRGIVPTPVDAVRARFKFQPGILASVAMEIDAAAGMMNNRVGQARRSSPAAASTIATAVGNS